MSDQIVCPDAIRSLVERFAYHRPAYLRGQYNETQLRREFIDPFFRALGWDVDNRKGLSEAYKEVAHEDPIKIRGQTNFLDYSFRIGGIRKFIVEAKKPSVAIKDDTESALQLRRYAWNAGLKLSILTNFEEFAVYDCTKPIRKGDTAGTARVRYITYQEYPEQWGWIAKIFSLECILKGAFDRFADSETDKKGTMGVDEAFLADIEDWRLILARNIALRNPAVTRDELNLAVQRTIDRIIFLRICEDRGIEPYGTLQELLLGDQVYQRLCDLFRHADDRYNSGLFHFEEEPGRNEPPDTLTLSLVIDDDVLKTIIRRLYYPESPYEFSAIPAEILGQIYEQFLGKVIRLTEGHRAKVEEKPEVRKAGGVFYTPTYIVDYIVRQTVGEVVQGKTPKEVSAITILDPACGSGSFLLGAYQFLLNWHRDWYIEHLVPVLKEKGATSPEVRALLSPAREGAQRHGRRGRRDASEQIPIYKAANGTDSRVRSDWRLTTAERKRILTNNIYGVDIDQQAVEVTKLSLLLKVLEDESEETVSKQLTLFAERALPSLHDNIKCGNSLVASDIYDGLAVLPGIEERKRINAFDWEREFAGILQRGGFDVVVGNPPYVRQETLGHEFKGYAKQHYAVYHGVADLYTYFIEKGVSLLRPGGVFGYIVANKWLRANYGKPLRRWLKERRIEEIVDFGDLPVFQGATTYPCIIRVSSGEPRETFPVTEVASLDFADLSEYVRESSYLVRQDDLDDDGWSLVDEQTSDLLKKVRGAGVPLGEYVQGKIYRGVLTGLNKAFVIDAETRDRLIAEDPRSAEVIKPFLAGRDVKRYAPLETDKFLIFTRRGIEINDYPAIKEYLKQFKKELMPRPKGWKGGKWEGRKPGSYQWYEIQDSIGYYQEFEKPKIIYAEIATRGQFTIDSDSHYSDTTSYIIGSDSPYLVGILNSTLWTFLFSNISSEIRGGFFRWKRQYMENLPIRPIDPSDPADVARHDRMVTLVEAMLDLNRRLA
ncbi:MAG: TaqI-like C-terminal specificity domain-containing protein, partial [Candidatus Methanoculleus thermohydrogenotrophicum]